MIGSSSRPRCGRYSATSSSTATSATCTSRSSPWPIARAADVHVQHGRRSTISVCGAWGLQRHGRRTNNNRCPEAPERPSRRTGCSHSSSCFGADLAGAWWLIRRPFGRVLAGVRENELRTQLLGYDVRRYKLVAFILGGAIAGLAGALYAAGANFINPSVFTLSRPRWSPSGYWSAAASRCSARSQASSWYRSSRPNSVVAVVVRPRSCSVA